MELSEKSGSDLSDSEISSTSSKSNNFHENLQRRNFETIEHSDCESTGSSQTTTSGNVNGKERTISWNKKLVVKLCDFVICSRKYCDVPNDKSYKKLQLHKKEKADQQHLPWKKSSENIIESSDEYTSGNDDVSNNEDVVDVKEISEDEDISNVSVVSEGKSDPDYHKTIEHSDCESAGSSPTTTFGNVNGKERTISWNKKLVVKLCDFMVCSRKYCDVPNYKKCGRVELNIKRKVEEQYFHSRIKRSKYKVESSDEYNSDVDEVSNNEEVVDVEEMSKDDDISSVSVVSENKSDSDYDKEEKSEEEIPSEETDGSDWEEINIKKKSKRKAKEKLKKMEKQTESLSDFELIRQKHVDDKMAFLKSLMMNEIVDDLEETAKSQVKRKQKTAKKPKGMLQASRKSKRMDNFNINLSEKALETKVYEDASTSHVEEKIKLPPVYSFEDALSEENNYDLNEYKKYFSDLEMNEKTPQTNSSLYDLGRFDPSVSTSKNYPFILSGIAFHPAADRTILLAASTSGQISLWNIDTEPYFFTPHLDYVTHLKVNPECPSQIISSSRDGTLRHMDIEKKSFVEVFKENSQCNYFDFISPKESLVAHSDGFISLVDWRESRNRSGFQCTTLWKGSEVKIRTISAHPVKKDLCLTLDSAGFLKVWDMRLIKQSVTSQLITDHSTLSALFSPVTGNSILCSSKLGVRTYCSSHLDQILRCQFKLQMPYKKKSASAINAIYSSQSTFYTMANWLPGSDSAFIVHNNAQKKTVILQSNGGQEMSCLQNLNTIVVFQEFHPLHNILAITKTAAKKSRIDLFLKEKVMHYEGPQYINPNH